MKSEDIFENRPARENYLVFGKPELLREEIDEVIATLESGWIGTGPRVEKFEENFRSYVGVQHAVAVNSCTAALYLSLLELGIGPGDEVITSPFTFAATANVVIHVGAKPVFVDIDRSTQNLDPALIEQAITANTKAILPIHYAGRPCDMDSILDIARQHGLFVVEDAAHAIGAEYKGRKVGTLGDLTAFSFYATKNVVTGEGGMVTTHNSAYADNIRLKSMHGISKSAWKRISKTGYPQYEVVLPGFSFNMTDLEAAIGLPQLARLESNLERREAIWLAYDEAFQDLPVYLPAPVPSNIRHARHLYTVLIDTDLVDITREEVAIALAKENIGSGVNFISLHLQPYYRDAYNFSADDFPNALFASERTLSLPFSSALSDADVEDVIAALRRILRRLRLKNRIHSAN